MNLKLNTLTFVIRCRNSLLKVNQILPLMDSGLLLCKRYEMNIKSLCSWKWIQIAFQWARCWFFFPLCTCSIPAALWPSHSLYHIPIFSKCMTFHKGIYHLDHLCPYNSVEKDNIRKIILVLGCVSAVVSVQLWDSFRARASWNNKLEPM